MEDTNKDDKNAIETTRDVGTILKEARLAKGLTIAEVEKNISIRGSYLEAIENSDFTKTPEEVYVKGMIRNYGNFLGLDGLELVNMFKASRAGTSTDKVRSIGIREVDKVHVNIQFKNQRELGSGTGEFKFSFKQCMAGFVVVLLLVAAYFVIPVALDYAQNSGNFGVKQEQHKTNVASKPDLSSQIKVESVNKSQNDSKQITQEAGIQKEITQETAAQEAVTQKKTTPETVAQEAIIQKAMTQEIASSKPLMEKKITVSMEAEGDCWLEVNADGEEVFVGMLKLGDQKTYDAKQRLIIKYGNISVMRVLVNGKPEDLHGEHGVAVKTYTLK